MQVYFGKGKLRSIGIEKIHFPFANCFYKLIIHVTEGDIPYYFDNQIWLF